jgi:hypothetical protein
VVVNLPVFATIAAAYRFLAREIATVVRLAWFPLIVVAIVQYFSAEAMLDGLSAGVDGTTEQTLASPYDLIEWVVQILVVAIVGVSLHRLILFGDHKPGQYIAFAFGRSEVFFVVLQVILFAGFLFVGLAWAIAFGNGAAPATGWSAMSPVLIMVLNVVVLIYLCTRLSLLYPIVVAENRLDFLRGLELTRGQFWRLLAVLLLGFLPLALLLGALEGGLWLLVSSDLPPAEAPGEEAVAIAKGMVIYQVGIFYVGAILASGMTAALLSFSYKALRGMKPDDLLTPEYQVRP